MLNSHITITRVNQTNSKPSQTMNFTNKFLFLIPHMRNTIHGQMTQSIGNYVSFARMIKNTHIIILQQFQPPSLPQIHVSLREHILQTFVVGKDIYVNTIQVMSPYLQSIYNNG